MRKSKAHQYHGYYKETNKALNSLTFLGSYATAELAIHLANISHEISRNNL